MVSMPTSLSNLETQFPEYLRSGRQVRDGSEGRLQFIDDARNQPADGGQFLGSGKLFLYGPLIQQPDGDADLIAQVLRQSLLVGGKVAEAVVLIQLENTDHLALGQHGDEQQRLGRAGGVPSGHGERAAADIRNHQRRAVVKASHGAGPRSAGRRSQGNRNRLSRLATPLRPESWRRGYRCITGPG